MMLAPASLSVSSPFRVGVERARSDAEPLGDGVRRFVGVEEECLHGFQRG
jgi:hypothetical protein